MRPCAYCGAPGAPVQARTGPWHVRACAPCWAFETGHPGRAEACATCGDPAEASCASCDSPTCRDCGQAVAVQLDGPATDTLCWDCYGGGVR